MAKAGFQKPTCQFKLHELDAQLASSPLTVAERLECKTGLDRVGLIAAACGNSAKVRASASYQRDGLELGLNLIAPLPWAGCDARPRPRRLSGGSIQTTA
jgi:hypothetical protein